MPATLPVSKGKGQLQINDRVYKGRIFQVGADEIEIYKIGVLAAALNKSSQAIEIWEKAGLFPKPMINLKGAGLGNCKRWYTKEQIINVAKVWNLFPYGSGRGRDEHKDKFFKTVKKVFYFTQEVNLNVKGNNG